MPKNILIFSDGTGNSGQADRPTNVHKLYKMVTIADTNNQIIYYREGVGAGRKYFGFLTGCGISKNILACYQYLCENYQPGDKVFLFGFSRGAATVRSLSGLIDTVGFIPNPTQKKIKKAYRIYKIRNSESRASNARKFQSENLCTDGSVHFLGVWDTVVSLGLLFEIPNYLLDMTLVRIKFHNFNLSQSVKHARHAIAIDELRYAFSAKLWDSVPHSHQTMKQVWFVGTHKNVGGGWHADQRLSDIALHWMIKEAKNEGLILNGDFMKFINPDSLGPMNDPLAHWLAKAVHPEEPRSWPNHTLGKPIVHKSVIERNQKDPSYNPWILQCKYEIHN